MKNETFVIRGKITGIESGRGLSRLKVTALDKDLIKDDRLGSCETDDNGFFKIEYSTKDFAELFDKRPDIYLQVANEKGEVIYTSIDQIRHKAGVLEEFHFEVPEMEVDEVKIENTRSQYKNLISVNPNYFGSLTDLVPDLDFKPVEPMQENTKYEELDCIGLYPKQNLLEGILRVKLPYGFSGDLCDDGSTEYVGFYIDYNDGAGFQQAGAIAKVDVHDLNFVNKDELCYAVRTVFDPTKLESCKTPQILRVRAILSWQSPPTGPNYRPAWGNREEAWIQIQPQRKYKLIKPIDLSAKLTPFAEQPLVLSGSQKELKSLLDASFAATEKNIHKLPEHRFNLKEILSKNPNYFGSITNSKDLTEIEKSIVQISPEWADSLKKNIGLEKLFPVEPIKEAVQYEELTCVGLHPETDLLEATIAIKKTSGYSGDLCTLGSTEYVAFWIDWGSGYQYVGTSTVAVHDIPGKEKPIMYAVEKAIPNIEKYLRDCNSENIVKVRAILSWNVDPTPYGPGYVPRWGNVLNRMIQIRPKGEEFTSCKIEFVNRILSQNIQQSGGAAGYAIKKDASGYDVPGVFDRPFGSIIAVRGNVNVSGATLYRFRFSDDAGVSWTNILDRRSAYDPADWIDFTKHIYPDPNGWFNIQQYKNDLALYSEAALVEWKSNGKNGSYRLQLQFAYTDASGNIVEMSQSCEIDLLLDNQGHELLQFGGSPAPTLPTYGIAVKDSSGSWKRCDIFTGKDKIYIYGNFKDRDEHFRNYYMEVFGGNLATSGVALGGQRYDSAAYSSLTPAQPMFDAVDDTGIIGAVANGSGRKLMELDLCAVPHALGPKVKCAYGIRLKMYDRSIVGYMSGYQFRDTVHGNQAYVTFDWDPAGC